MVLSPSPSTWFRVSYDDLLPGKSSRICRLSPLEGMRMSVFFARGTATTVIRESSQKVSLRHLSSSSTRMKMKIMVSKNKSNTALVCLQYMEDAPMSKCVCENMIADVEAARVQSPFYIPRTCFCFALFLGRKGARRRRERKRKRYREAITARQPEKSFV